jgi:small-conductance mechanosensitive channel
MNGVIQFTGKDHVLQLFGIPLVGVSASNAKKLAFTVVFLLLVWIVTRVLHAIARGLFGERTGRSHFWAKQIIRIITFVLGVTGVVSIWFNDPSRLAQAGAFITAGLAIASQRVITAVAGYLIILRGKTFQVGDRIVMGGVRGDVVALSFMQTTIMEMGQAPGEQPDAPSVWIEARQYTGRLVKITNDKLFDTPVYNYTRDFPYLWEEIRLPIPYKGDRVTAEKIILDAVRRNTVKITELGEEALQELERRYVLRRQQLEPRVFMRLTDNWVELAVRFLVEDHGIRDIKDRVSREVLDAFDRANIEIASGTYEVVGMPELKVRLADAPARDGQ